MGVDTSRGLRATDWWLSLLLTVVNLRDDALSSSCCLSCVSSYSRMFATLILRQKSAKMEASALSIVDSSVEILPSTASSSPVIFLTADELVETAFLRTLSSSWIPLSRVLVALCVAREGQST